MMGSKPKKRIDVPELSSRTNATTNDSTSSSSERPSKRAKSDESVANPSTDTTSNPYLAHLTSMEIDSSSAPTTLPQLTPGTLTADLASQIESGDVNPYTGRPFSKRYRDILTKRRDLPVHQQRQDFLDLVHQNQIIVFVGETGSGKTTQCVS